MEYSQAHCCAAEYGQALMVNDSLGQQLAEGIERPSVIFPKVMVPDKVSDAPLR